MRLYEENGKWKVGKHGEAKHNSREAAKYAYVDEKMKKLKKELTKVTRKRNS
jgi:hypothetical protein